MPDDLRTRIAEVLNTTPAGFLRDHPDSLAFHVAGLAEEVLSSRHDRHNYLATCALCRGEADALADAVIAVVQPELDRRDAAEAKVRADIAAAEADLARCRERLEDTRRIVAEWEDATAERDRYRAAWQSARLRAEGSHLAAVANAEACDHARDQGNQLYARVTALAADMRTWCSPHGLADHYANQLDQAIAGPNPNPPYDLPAGFRAGAGGEQ